MLQNKISKVSIPFFLNFLIVSLLIITGCELNLKTIKRRKKKSLQDATPIDSFCMFQTKKKM